MSITFSMKEINIELNAMFSLNVNFISRSFIHMDIDV